EKIKKYDAGEVAHIENALKGEFRQRIHRKLNRSEETSIFEEETAKEEQEELATTERFELQHETSKVISEEIENKMAHGFSVETGGEGSAGAYSFYIDAGYNYAGESSSSNSMEKSDQQSSTFSREVTSKAATRIAERRREELVKKVLEEIEETNTHEIDNKGEGATHVTGIYQWVDKVYEVRKYNYGSHMMFDIMVPEPGAFYREALLSHPPEGSEFLEPAPFDKKASEITASNYLKYTKKYKVTGIEPPPLKYITLSKVFKQKAPNNEGTSSSMIEGEEINIPEGYQAVSANVVVSSGYFSGPKVENMDLGKLKAHVRLSLGRKTWDKKQYIGGTKHSYKLNNEKGSIPISLRTFNTTAFIANIEVNCQRTTRAYLEWQIRTHAAIMEQYLNLKMEYEESLAAAGIRQGIAIQGRNPEENRKIEKAELKKLCLSIITGQHFDDFDSLYYPDDSPLPQIKFHTAQSEGLYIRFFEQAFEWENMMYVFYPYFWSRKALWLDRLFIQDTDPLHVEFLKSGSARVVLPVRENFEEPVLHFLETGEIPTTEELCDINSDLYLPIAEEIKEKQGASNGKYRPVDTWEVRLPTQLVILRPDGTLPNWESEEEE
ncbi:MAG: hypothetical protein KDC75_15715, partial [Phaeodactylibacter sp.]|nr:hypothetical protein [Phaeodactylibacter sp.]